MNILKIELCDIFEIQGTKGAISRKHLRPTGALFSLDGEQAQEHPNEQYSGPTIMVETLKKD